MIAALYVAASGVYFGDQGVDPWDEARDARLYAGPHPVVAHPDCKRWGRYWHGAPNKPHQFKLGDDGGCFAAALAAVRKWGGGAGASRSLSRLDPFRADQAPSDRRVGHG
jgi:hypothetical protein